MRLKVLLSDHDDFKVVLRPRSLSGRAIDKSQFANDCRAIRFRDTPNIDLDGELNSPFGT